MKIYIKYIFYDIKYKKSYQKNNNDIIKVEFHL